MLTSTTGKAQRPDISSEQRLRQEENVKMQGPVIIGRVVFVIAVLDHLIDEPAVDALVEVRRLDPEEKEAEEGSQCDNQPRCPIGLGEAAFQFSS